MTRRYKHKKENPLDYITIPRLNIDPEIKRGIWSLALLALAIISILALFDAAGLVGGYLETGLVAVFGWGKWVFPLAVLALVWFIFNHDKREIKGTHYFGLALFLISLQGLLHIFINQAKWSVALKTGAGGGYVGWLVVWALIKTVGFWAGLIILIVLLLVSLMLAFNTTLANLWAKGSWPARFLMHPVKSLLGKGEGEDGEEDEEEHAEDEDEEEEEHDDEEDQEEDEDEEVEAVVNGQRAGLAPVLGQTTAAAAAAQNLAFWQPTGIKIELPLNLLNGNGGKPKGGDIKNNAAIIQKTLEEFDIKVEMGDVSVGPTVTQYTLKPADGVKLSKITTLNNDLAMALAAHPVRIEAPIPGKSLVGIEVPNKAAAVVNLKSILSSEAYKNRQTNTMVSLGKDVAGKSWLADIHKMPHLLVAGATGSGKSVLLNALVVSLLYQNNPDDLRFIMVDPKRVELTIYDGIPHLLTPVITEVSKTINALKWCLNEMDRRFQTLARVKKRDIDSYNKTAKNKMPYIVFIIDELADLMVVAAKDIETGIVRLAQMARAVGIHLVLATQRPSVNVITGTIKANMPARIAFSVASGIDSRTILDGLGAEKLLGKGDMLFSDATMSKPKRIQGAYVSDAEIKRVVNYLKSKGGRPAYLDGVTDRQKVQGVAGVGIDGGSDDDDSLTQEAKEIVINAGKASATLLQRRLSIGYARAAKILDILEEAGIIGPAQGAKPREVMVSREQYEVMLSQGVSSLPLHNRQTSQVPSQYLAADDYEASASYESDEDEAEEDDDEVKEPEEENDDQEENDDEEDTEEDEEESADEDEDNEEDEGVEEFFDQKIIEEVSESDESDDGEDEETEDEDDEDDNDESDDDYEELPDDDEEDLPTQREDDDDFEKYFSR